MSREVERPERPAVPVALLALVAALLAERVVLRLSADAAACGMLACVLAGVSALCLALSRAGRRVGQFVPVTCACAAVAVAVAGALAWREARCAAALEGRPVSSFSFVTTGEPSEGTYGWRCRARVLDDAMPLGEVWLTGPDALARGSTLTCVGAFVPAGDDDWGVANRMQGVCGTVSVRHALAETGPAGVLGVVASARGAMLASLDPDSSDARAILAGCVLGSRDAVDSRGLDALFSACGMSHMVAVSGSHIAIVSAVAAALLAPLGLAPRTRMLVLGALTGAFVVVCGLPASAVRAWLMAMAALGAQVVGRRAHALSAVSVAALVMALVDPSLSGQVGYLLSVSCVTALCLYGRWARYLVDVILGAALPPRLARMRLGRRLAKALASLRSSFAATLVAQAASLPVTVPVFGQVSLVAPVANLVLVPLFTPLMALGLGSVLLTPLPGLQALALAPADALGSLVAGLLRLLARVPLASVSVEADGLALGLALAAAGVALLVWWPRVSRGAVAGASALAACAAAGALVAWRWFAPARVCVLDVGQGDAILVQDGGAAVLVDAGPEGAAAPALAEAHVLHLDACVITHLHDDHYGGLESLVGSVPCDLVLVAEGVSDELGADLARTVSDLTGTGVRELPFGSTLRVGGFTLAVVWPQGEVSGAENEDSLVMTLAYAGEGAVMRALLTGDGEQDVLAPLLDEGLVGRIDLLKVGHHGSAASIDADAAARLAPSLAVASAGEGNAYGHPTDECVETLEAAGAAFLCTKDVGTVDVRPGNGELVVRTSRAPP